MAWVPKPGAVPVWEANQREAHAQVWEAVVPFVNRATGQERWQKQRFVEIATGLHYRDAQGQWRRSREEFQLTPDGYAVAQAGPHQLVVGPNVNGWVVDFRAPDGLRLRAGPVALGYFDPVSGQNLILATVRDAPGQLTASNAVTFDDCFEGIHASLRVTYRRAGVSSDLLLHEAPPDPETLGLSRLSRLELYTEFHPDDPVPQATPRVLRTETDPALRQSLAEPDLLDHELDYGAYRMGPGTAFEVNGRQETAPVPVLKRYLVLPDGRHILIEAVEFSEARKHFAALRPGRSFTPPLSPGSRDEGESRVAAAENSRVSPSPLNGERAGVRGEKTEAPPQLTRFIPQRRTMTANVSLRRTAESAALSRAQPRVDAALASRPAFLLDWSLLTGDTNVTLAGDTTYFVSGNVYLYGTTTIEGSVVVKYTNWGGIYLRGPVECQTGPLRPAVLTSQDDDSVGQVLPWSTGNPYTNHCANPALEVNSYATNVATRLDHLRVAHARLGVSVLGGEGHEVRHAQFVRCLLAMQVMACELRLRNVLVHDAGAVFWSSLSPTVRGEHLTINLAGALNANGTPALYLTNSLFVAVTNLGGYFGANNAVETDPADVFTTVGAGAHYLLPTSLHRNQGTTNIQPELLAELRQRTTYPPQWLTNTITTDTWLTPVVPRDADAPDRGWHYPAVDYAACLFTITNNATVRVAPGTVIATFGPTAVWMPDGSQLLCEGTPRQPVQWAPYYAVQEQSTNWGGYWPSSTTKLNPWHWTSGQPAPTARFRFTDFHGMSGEGWHLYTDDDVWSFATFAATDCSFSSAGAWFAGPEGSAYTFTNCLFDRLSSGSLLYSPEISFYNNHVRGGELLVWNLGSAVWRFHDNVFDGVWLGGTDVTNSHNAYLNLPDPSCRLTPTNATDLATNGLAFQTGPLGRYYQPPDSPLINAGSRWATNAGLYHYTTTTNQVKEGATAVDRGLHYVALDGIGSESQPLDGDADGVPDWLEDKNGNGAQDIGETSVTRPDSPFVPRDYEPLGPSSRKTPLVISEIMYNPASGNEFIELYNTHHLAQDISGFQLTFGAQPFSPYLFPANTILQPNTFLHVSFTGRLGNNSDRIRLLNKVGGVLLEVEYEDDFPWPVAADGAGHSLVLVRPSYGENDFRSWAASERIGGSPGNAETTQADRLRAIVINEFLADSSPGDDFIELHNRSNETIDVSGCWLSDNQDELDRFRIPSGTVISPRGFVYFREDTDNWGFGLAAGGERVLLTTPDLGRVLDAVRFAGQSNGVSMGRSPDGAPWFTAMLSQTPGATNSGPRGSDVILTEIMFNPLSGDDDGEFVELHNRTASPIIVTNWTINGVGYTIPGHFNTTIPANGFVVVARNTNTLQSRYPNLNAANTVGDYFPNRLGNRLEHVALRRPRSSNVWVVLDEVLYRDGGQWGSWADADGSSLELKDARSDHRRAANWADSATPTNNAWVTIQTTGRLQLGDSNAANVIEISLMGAGECLLTNVQVVPSGGANLVLNSTFATTNNWAMEGNYYLSTITNGYLHLRTDGRGDYVGNRVAGKLSSSIASNTLVTISANVRWQRGSPEILLRLRGNGLELATNISPPLALGTPGLTNSTVTTNAGPAIYEVLHQPAVPLAAELVVVTARVTDPDGVTNVALKYRLDPSGTVTTLTMNDQGISGDALAGDGIYSATLPGQPTGTLVAFRVEATDSFGVTNRFPTARAMYPGDTERRECLVRWGDAQPASSFGVYRMWMTQATANQWASRSRFQVNDYSLDVTFVYGSERVIYNAAASFAGSDNTSLTHNSPTNTLCGYNLTFPGDDRFLGANAALWDWPIKDRTGQREQMAYWMAQELGLPVNHRRFVHLYVNGRTPEQRPNANGFETARIYEDAQNPDTDYLEQWFPNDAAGELYKLYAWRQGFPEFPLPSGYSQQHANLLNYTNSTGKNLPSYRWTWRKRAVQDSAHNYTNLHKLVDAFNSYTNYIADRDAIADIEQWARVFVANRIVGNLDVYQNLNGHNLYAYKPQGSRWVLFPYDLDLVMGETSDATTTSLFSTSQYTDPRIIELLSTNAFRRAYWRAFQDAVNGPMQSSRYGPVADANYAALLNNGVKLANGTTDVQAPGSATGFTTWLEGRRNFISGELNKLACGFAITNNGGADFTTSASSVLLAGKAPPQVKFIALNSTLTNVIWHTVTNWNLSVTLSNGANPFTVQGYDRFTNALNGTNASITITKQP